MTVSSQQKADEVRLLEQAVTFQWRAWSAIIDAELAHIAAAQSDNDAMAALFGRTTQVGGKSPRDQAVDRLLQMFAREQHPDIRQVVDFAYEVLGGRQRAAHEADTQARISEGQQPRSREAINEEVFRAVQRELKGEVDPKNERRAGLVYWRKEAPTLSLTPTVWFDVPRHGTSINDFQSGGKIIGSRPNKKKGFLILGGLLAFVILMITLIVSTLTGTKTNAQGSSSSVIINGALLETWQGTGAKVDLGAMVLDATTSSTAVPLTLCIPLRDKLGQQIKETTTITVTVQAATRTYQRQDSAPNPDVELTSCNDGAILYRGMVNHVVLDQPMDMNQLVAVRSWASDVMPSSIAGSSMRVDVVWKGASYREAQLILPDGQRLSPAETAMVGEYVRVSYLIPATEFQTEMGLLLEQTGLLPLRAAITIPAPVHREEWLKQAVKVEIGTPHWMQEGGSTSTIEITVTITPYPQELSLIPITLQIGDIQASQGQRQIVADWQPPTISTSAATATVRVPVTLESGAVSLTIGRETYHIRWSPTR